MASSLLSFQAYLPAKFLRLSEGIECSRKTLSEIQLHQEEVY